MNGGFAASAFSDSAFANYAFDFDDYAVAVYAPGKWNPERVTLATQRSAEVQTAARPDDALTDRLVTEPADREIRFYGERPVSPPATRARPVTGTRASR